ncbi:hypothetical protein, partial [Flavihumibacter sp. ZG627]|uniref:beta strand repeat-containing protein n=1 Tax=Flavihumibacter sp. ZG627 TaxID=1463156 RepID=UPI001C1194F6
MIQTVEILFIWKVGNKKRLGVILLLVLMMQLLSVAVFAIPGKTLFFTPSASITSGPATICTGSSTDISLNIVATGAWTLTLDNSGGSVSGNGSGNFIISVSPTVSTTYKIASLSDEEGAAAAGDLSGEAVITVNQHSTLNRTSLPVTTNQTICIGSPITLISYFVGGGGTGVEIEDLPVGVNYTINNGIVFIMGTPTLPGNYTYTVRTIGPCNQAQLTGNINVRDNSSIDLSSAIGTESQTLCINTPITNITYAVGGTGNDATVTGLPAGVSGNYSGGVFTISGTPTESGTFNYIVTTVGPCAEETVSGTITVQPNSSISLTSAAATEAQTLCINTPITSITYAVGGTGNDATVTGLPAGVSGNYSGGVYTISGTPTESGTFNYTVTTVGPCAEATANGTITVQPNSTINLTSAAATEEQILCINTPITNISYAVGGTGNDATVTGLPAGVSGNYSGGVFTISGTPTESGTFNYIVTTVGPCAEETVSGTITVQPNSSISLTSAAVTESQTLCINTPITNITYAVGGTATDATVIGLPDGVTGTYIAGVFTISGTPTESGTFIYIVTTVGPCAEETVSGTITVQPNSSISLTSAAATEAQTLCINTPITNITYAVGGTATDATVTGLPTGVLGNYSAGVFTISGTPSVTGTFNYVVTTVGPCAEAMANGTITVQP